MTDAVTGARLPCGLVALGSGAFVAESVRLAVPSESTIRTWLHTESATPRQVVVGARSIVLDDVVVQEGTTIGSDCVVGGFVCDGAILGECIVMGSLVHGVRDPDLPWGQYEPNPMLEERVFVGRPLERKRWGY